jgi:CheY-like chemotaxis protein
MVLVVEDNAATREALVESLRLLNYQVLEASNGQQALTIFEQHVSEIRRDADRIALVLSDVVMPGMGGVALFHALREKSPEIRVVLLTGHPLEDELKNLRTQGLGGWLLKPPSLERLAEVMAQALRER